MKDSDSNLLAALLEGDSTSFSLIYRKYAAELYHYARKNIATKEDCEEIIQEVFLSLWAQHKSLQIQSLRHYLFNAVRYKIIRYFQHSAVKAKYEAHYKYFESHIYEEGGERTPEPEQIREKILQQLKPLPERCQEAFRLRLMENLSNHEIAERMNIAKKTVELYMFKAFNHLRTNAKDLISADLE